MPSGTSPEIGCGPPGPCAAQRPGRVGLRMRHQIVVQRLWNTGDARKLIEWQWPAVGVTRPRKVLDQRLIAGAQVATHRRRRVHLQPADRPVAVQIEIDERLAADVTAGIDQLLGEAAGERTRGARNLCVGAELQAYGPGEFVDADRRLQQLLLDRNCRARTNPNLRTAHADSSRRAGRRLRANRRGQTTIRCDRRTRSRPGRILRRRRCSCRSARAPRWARH